MAGPGIGDYAEVERVMPIDSSRCSERDDARVLLGEPGPFVDVQPSRYAPARLCEDGPWSSGASPYDLVIEIKNEPGALARVAAAISDAGVNLAGATCVGTAGEVELHVLVPHAERVKRALAISQLAVSREREVVVVEVEDRPGVLADLARKVARAGIDLDLVYVATRNRLAFGAADLDALKVVLER